MARSPEALELLARLAFGATAMPRGELALARDHLERGVALYRPDEHRALAFVYGHDPGVLCLCYLAFARHALGDARGAAAASTRALELARGGGQAVSLVWALHADARLHQLRGGDPKAARASAESAMALAAEHAMPGWRALGAAMRGAALAAAGDPTVGAAAIRQALAAYLATGTRIWQTWVLGMLADAERRSGALDRALATVREALATAERTAERWHEPDLLLLEGELLVEAAPSDAAAARSRFERAHAVALAQSAAPAAARAAAALVTLAR